MNLISGTYYSCERKEYIFMIFREYTIISDTQIYSVLYIVSVIRYRMLYRSEISYTFSSQNLRTNHLLWKPGKNQGKSS